jgi:hypothetical protein
MTVSLKCVECGVDYQAKAYQAETRKFCSVACKNKNGRLTLQCEHCKQPFWVFKSIVNYQSKRFCSMACRKVVMAAKPKPPKRVSEPIFKICKTCETVFKVPPSRKDKAVYCSQKCKGSDPEYRLKSSKAQRGEKSAVFVSGESVNQSGYMKTRVWGERERTYTTSHRVVMAYALNAENPEHPFLTVADGLVRIRPEIHVHHIDRNKLNNDVSNLLAVTHPAHIQIHKSGRKPDPWECWPSNPTNW